MAYGTGVYGIAYFGFFGALAPPVVRELGPIQFDVEARSEGGTIRVKWSTPSPADSPSWSRRLRILRKRGEWAQSWDDSDAVVIVDDSFPALANDHFLDQTGLESGTIYYYSMYMERLDGTWVVDSINGQKSAYAFNRWGFVDYIMQTLPRGFRSQDAGVDHLYQFVSILGAVYDNVKTDVEHLLTLMEIDTIHSNFIRFIDDKLGWPTWTAAGGLQRRKDTEQAVDLYKLVGREAAYEQLIENATNWEVEILEGWRYVFFTNDRFSSRTPDFTHPDTRRLLGRQDDIVKYTCDTEGWHSVSGLGFFLTQIPIVSGPLSIEFLSRVHELIDTFKASYVTYNITVVPIDDEVFLLSNIYETLATILAPIIQFTIEEPDWQTGDLSLFSTNDAGTTTNTVADRTFHNDITYI